MTVGYTYIAYGFLVLVGGLMGFLKAKSTPSLVAGGLFGALLVWLGATMLRTPVPATLSGPGAWVYFTAFAITLFLLVFFAARYVRTKAVMPAGLMVGLSLVALLVLFFG